MRTLGLVLLATACILTWELMKWAKRRVKADNPRDAMLESWKGERAADGGVVLRLTRVDGDEFVCVLTAGVGLAFSEDIFKATFDANANMQTSPRIARVPRDREWSP
jgi:hypothetical protein